MPVPVHAARRPRRLLRDVTFETICDAVVDGTLAPGERIFEDDVAAWLGVSKTPVKEALARLATHGLVEIEANRSTRVATADDLDLVDTLELIGVLHGAAIRSLPCGAAASAAVLADRAASVLDHDPTCLALVEATGAFLELARNPLLRRTAEPLHLRTAFLCRHLTVDWSRPALAPLLADLRSALGAHDLPGSADALTHLFRHGSLRDAVDAVPPPTTAPADDGSETRPGAASVVR
jgi:DNA-binding GntR family transcriptional regulator